MLALDRLFDAYFDLRESPLEHFADAVGRLGVEPFRTALYGIAHAA